MDIFAKVLWEIKSDVELHSYCLLTSMELILRPNNSLLHLQSNDMNSLKRLAKKKCSNKSNVKKNQQNSLGEQPVNICRHQHNNQVLNNIIA